jgi:hypothetical protein
MAPRDELLSLDMGTDDCFYRFRRDFELTSTVVYVHLQTLDIIPQDHQTYGPGLIKDLRSNVEVWDQQWTTLTVFREDGKVRYAQDQWKPHFLPPNAASGDLPRLNVLNLEIRHGFKNRVSLIQLDMQRQILKICPFMYQLQYFTQEIKAYNTLSKRGCSLIPRLSSYVFERSEEQIIGFTCEEFKGRFARPSDYSKCKHSLLQLHSYGIVHGDLNKFNIIITADGPRFFDLEKSVLDTEEISKDEFSRLQQEELDGLEKALHDEEGWGKPWLELEL